MRVRENAVPERSSDARWTRPGRGASTSLNRWNLEIVLPVGRPACFSPPLRGISLALGTQPEDQNHQPDAASILASASCRPNAASVASIPGLTVLPVKAARSG